MDFKDNFKRIREEKRLTQEDIANEVGISRQSVSKWENGVSEPDIATIKKLCKILDCSISELLEGKRETKEMPDNSDSEAINNILALKNKNSKSMAIYIVVLAIAIVLVSVLLPIFFTRLYEFEMSKVSGGMDPSVGLFQQVPASNMGKAINEYYFKLFGDYPSDSIYASWANNILVRYTLYKDTYWFNIPGKLVVPYWALIIACIAIIIAAAVIILLTTTVKNHKKYLKQLEELKYNQ